MRVMTAQPPAATVERDAVDPAAGAGLSRGLIFLMSLAAGATLANNYTLQPLLPEIAHGFAATLDVVGVVAGSGQVGYMLGLALLTPLGDRIDRRRMVLWQLAGLAAALAAASLAPGLWTLAAASVAAGAMATIVIHLNAVAAHVARPALRGQAIGAIATGVAIGALLARTAGGVVGGHFGWRAVPAAGALVTLALIWPLARRLPAGRPDRSLRYRDLVGSLWPLFRRHRLLREAAAAGACWFAVFSAFWASLAAHVAGGPFHYGPEAAGLFGLVGVVGAASSRVAGRLADRIGPRPVIAAGLACLVLAFLAMARFGDTLWGLVAGVVLIDLGCFAAQVANQTRVLAIDAAARSRIISVYMVLYYAAGAAGSALGPILLLRTGWAGLCLACAAVSVAGIVAVWAGALRRA